MTAKKRGRKKKSEEIANKHELPGGFWRQIMAFLMIVLAILLVVSWLGSGGVALQTTDEFLMRIFGYTKYLFPVILVYLSVLIFKAPDNRVDPSVWVASILIIFWFCGIFGVPSYGKDIQTGGVIGEGMNSVVVKNLDQPVSILIYIVLIIITALFMYAETPAALFRKIGSMFKTKEKEDVENANVIRRTKAEAASDDGMRNFKVNSNVDIVDSTKEKKGLLVKNADKAEKVEEPTALISVSDPNWKMPPMDLLNKKHSPADPGDTHSNAATIKDTL